MIYLELAAGIGKNPRYRRPAGIEEISKNVRTVKFQTIGIEMEAGS